jgi:hypothetical protein
MTNRRHEGFEPHLTDSEFYKTKSAPNCGTLSYLYNILADHVSQFWNTIEPSLLTMYKKLKELEIKSIF